MPPSCSRSCAAPATSRPPSPASWTPPIKPAARTTSPCSPCNASPTARKSGRGSRLTFGAAAGLFRGAAPTGNSLGLFAQSEELVPVAGDVVPHATRRRVLVVVDLVALELRDEPADLALEAVV